ncbi:MAG: type II CRISPR-associated endonuclease Cas1 [Bacteroidetes bacterium]|jgi:CRISPR-associated protein Cas1|nr:type II CRISPR-associated endonuclease Cas1 [Bacteroidota bacterium]
MLKRTVYFSSPCYLSVRQQQLIVKKEDEATPVTIPVEDLGFVVLEHQQISVSLPLLDALAENNVAVIFCNKSHMPHSMLFPLEGNHLQSELYRQQIAISEPLKKQLWKQTVETKIINQAGLLNKLGKAWQDINALSRDVKSGDAGGREGMAAKMYWNRLFGKEFTRERYGPYPNNFLNYGYIVLRAAVARALTGSGLLPTFGIHHHNRYNAYCLADDIMEPYRPFVDAAVYEIYENYPDQSELEKDIKAELLQVLTVDVQLGQTTRPLMVGLSQTTASLARCFAGEQRKVDYPLLQ